MASSPDKNSMCIGIDLGTTNTTVCVSRVDLNGTILLEDCEIRQRSEQNERNQECLPSILYVKKDKKEVVGYEAKELKRTVPMTLDTDVCFIENSKRYIGTNHTWKIHDTVYTAIDVATKILTHVRKFSKIRDLLDEAMVYITVPANFDTDQINNTLEAAKRAGFKNVRLRPEPKAAVLGFLHEESLKREKKLLDLSEKKRLLVMDIGGGTCDICIEDVWCASKTGYHFLHKGVGRDNIGGIDFDVRIADFLVSKYKSFTFTKTDRQILMEAAQTIKEILSLRIHYHLEDLCEGNLDEAYQRKDWKGLIKEVEEVVLIREFKNGKLSLCVSVDEFCDCIISLIKKTSTKLLANKEESNKQKNIQALVENTLIENRIDKKSIDMIFLTGGMSKCFVLKALLYQFFKKPIIGPSDPMLSVSRGAALMNHYEEEELNQKDIMPRSILMETSNGRFKTLVAMGESVPVTKRVDEVFKTTSRTGVMIRLFEGRDAYDNQLRKLNSVYKVTFEPKELGEEFTITYTIDRTKRITFMLHFLKDDSKYRIQANVNTTGE